MFTPIMALAIATTFAGGPIIPPEDLRPTVHTASAYEEVAFLLERGERIGGELEQQRREREEREQRDLERLTQTQELLSDLGWYRGQVDGIHGPLTEDAIEGFAEAAEVDQDPEVLLAALNEDDAPKAPPPPPPPPAPTPAPQASAPAVSSGTPWDAIAACESNGNWAINTGNGYYGGLQFNKMSWDWAVDVGGHNVPTWPHEASRGQQIAVAETLRRIHPAGLGAWPACTRKLGLR